MQLINTDGMVFIGPGSEWFWTTIGSIVTAVSLIAIFRQLRLQRSAGAIEQIDSFLEDFFSERMLRYQRDVLVALRGGVDPASVPIGSGSAIANYLERLGTLAQAGHLDLEVLGGATGICQAWWATLAPMMQKARTDAGMAMMFGSFEWLVGRFAERDRRAGVTIRYDEAYVTASLQRRIAYIEDRIRVEQAIRTVIFASPGDPTKAAPTQSASTSTSEG